MNSCFTLSASSGQTIQKRRVNELSRLVLINLKSRIVWNWEMLSRRKISKTRFENSY